MSWWASTSHLCVCLLLALSPHTRVPDLDLDSKLLLEKLQRPACVIEFRGCASAQNLSKQFCTCNCCLNMHHYGPDATRSVFMCHPAVRARRKHSLPAPVDVKPTSEQPPSDILDN